jgi:hypothetical protein
LTICGFAALAPRVENYASIRLPAMVRCLKDGFGHVRIGVNPAREAAQN